MHIVLVDPSRAIQTAFTRILEPRGHVVVTFSDPGAALGRICSDSAIDALICSAELTPISGVELCWEVRLVAGDRRPIYILLTSSSCDERTMVEALDCGADDFISKPPRPEELYAKLRVAERLLKLQRELISLATTDPLTGIYNRRAFFEEAKEACRRASQQGPLSAILLDIDHFKQVNDLYGHHAGDKAICAIAAEARRSYALVGRLGGDEFSVLLPGHALAAAVEAAEDLRRRFADLTITTDSGQAHFTCSLGVSEWQPGETIDDLIRRADLALYCAKNEGRDSVGTPPSEAWLRVNPRQVSSIARAGAR
jgi:diguanylate cyclase (GGDEF)-like protein